MTVKNNLIWVGASLAVFLFLISFGNKTLLYMNTADLIGSLGSQCAPNWQCNSWTECNSRGEAYRQCADINNCMRAVSPDTSRDCVLTPEMLTSYQNDYENKLLNIGGDTSKIKVDFTGGIGEQNSGDCQYINDTSPICYYFNLPGNMSIKFSNSQASGDSSQGEMTFINGDTNKKLMTGIGSLKDPLNKISAGFYVYPTNSENIFYIVGDKTIENNIMSWKEIYFDVSKQDIVFYADAGVNLGGTNVSFVNIKKGAQKEYDINVNLPSSCTFPEKYGLNGIFVNNVKTKHFVFEIVVRRISNLKMWNF